MLVIKSIDRKETTSKTTGKVYVSYRVKGAYKNETDGLMYGATVNLDSKAIEKLINDKVISKFDDLVGHQVQFARLYPVFLTDFEKQYGIKYDYIVSIK